HRGLPGRDQRVVAAQVVLAASSPQPLALLDEVPRRDLRLVCQHDALEARVEVGEGGAELLVEGPAVLAVAPLALRQEVVELLPRGPQLEALLDQLRALADPVELCRVE